MTSNENEKGTDQHKHWLHKTIVSYGVLNTYGSAESKGMGKAK